MLTTTSDALQLVTATGVSTIMTHTSYVDNASGVLTAGRLNKLITTAATTVIGPSPLTNPLDRNILAVTIRNNHATASDVVTLQHLSVDPGPVSTTAILLVYPLNAGETLQYFSNGGFFVMDANGNIILSASANGGRLLKYNLLTTSTTFTTGPNTNSIWIRVVAGGGQGGGAQGGSSQAGVGGGGSSGGYAEKLFSVSPSTTYTYAIGQGGTTSTGNTTGQDGTNSTFAVGATTVTANGGKGGIGALASGTTVAGVLGGASPAVSTSGDLNAGGGAPDVSMQRENRIAQARAMDRTTANYENAARAVSGNLAGRGGDTGLQSGIDSQIKAALAGESAKTLSNEQSGIEMNTLEAGRDKYNRALAGMETLSGQYNPEQFGTLAGSVGSEAFNQAKSIDQQKGGFWKTLGGIAKAGIGAGMAALTGGASTIGAGAFSNAMGLAKNAAMSLPL